MADKTLTGNIGKAIDSARSSLRRWVGTNVWPFHKGWTVPYVFLFVLVALLLPWSAATTATIETDSTYAWANFLILAAIVLFSATSVIHYIFRSRAGPRGEDIRPIKTFISIHVGRFLAAIVGIVALLVAWALPDHAGTSAGLTSLLAETVGTVALTALVVEEIVHEPRWVYWDDVKPSSGAGSSPTHADVIAEIDRLREMIEDLGAAGNGR